MANGHALSDLVENGRGKWAILTTVVLTVSSGLSWWISTEGRDYTDARVAAEVAAKGEVWAMRTQANLDEIVRLERALAEARQARQEEFGRVWAEMRTKVNRENAIEWRDNVDQQITRFERRLERLEERYYGRSPRDSQR